MKIPLNVIVVIVVVYACGGLFSYSEAEITECRTCDEVKPGSPLEVRIEYRDGTSRSACGLRCAGAIMAAYREKDTKTLWIRERGTGKLLDAKKAFWVIGLKDGQGEAFSEKSAAESFSAGHGGRVANFGGVMAALFSGMYDSLRKADTVDAGDVGDDIVTHPKCAYCGMDRKQYAYSRVLLKYRDGSETALCSVHCAGLDLALHPEKVPARILVGTYDGGVLVDAEKAVWVLGGSKHGVMSIRGKWAFKTKDDAQAFMHDSGGSVSDFRSIMTAAFEDMWEIIR